MAGREIIELSADELVRLLNRLADARQPGTIAYYYAQATDGRIGITIPGADGRIDPSAAVHVMKRPTEATGI